MEQKINQTPQILDFLLRPAVEYNPPKNTYWGVSFHEGKAYVVSGLFCICVEGFKGLDPEGEFFSFFESKYIKRPYRITMEEILGTINDFNFVGQVTFPITNLINRLDTLDDNKKKKARVVITQTIKEEDDILVKFAFNGQQLEFKPNGIKPFRIANNSLIPGQFVKPGVSYRCKEVEELETGDAYYMNVIEPYGKVRAGVIYSEAGFIPTNMDMIHRLIGVPQESILCTNICQPEENLRMPPIHLSAIMLYDLLKVFLVTNSKLIEMHFGDDPNKHVMFKNIKENPDDLQVTIYVATLDPGLGIQRR